MIGFYFGGLVATSIITFAQAADDGEALNGFAYFSLLIWPITLAAYVVAIVRGEA